ncbi:hypothetical protein L249_8671 [Ophiocordyceps polyrhachis-furcata BCC 54312]|uniref:Uncharacterized protein n=1 Tax=Ophiocordyceps polyrhachis-furcata BCC 54312 TaxID=1330021 RepID=A0A367L6E4_9HYPO|nr:hypothetical protein L249_8671 [Ophiocordyceps polyrhachis-furcata BCC 54312]
MFSSTLPAWPHPQPRLFSKHANHALQLLELGRGVIAGLLMDMRGDLSEVKDKHPALADEFVALRDELDKPEESLPPLTTSFGNTISSWESSVRIKG